MIAQVASAVFGGHSSIGFFYIQATTALILVLAANTAFNGFPLLGSILARDRNLPAQLANRGDRLAYSNGILMLAVAAGFLIFVYHADVSKLIQLYILGVFTSFTLGQSGMVRHWNRELKGTRDAIGAAPDPNLAADQRLRGLAGRRRPGHRRHHQVHQGRVPGDHRDADPVLPDARRSTSTTSTWPTSWPPTRPTLTLPSRNHAVVLVSKLHKPTLRALAYAKATRPDTLTALTVNIEDETTRRLLADWERHNLPIELTVLESPYREMTRPVIAYFKQLRKDNPRELVSVFIPEYVVGHWWEQLLHNQSPLRLKGRLLYQPGVVVVSVPWQLDSSERIGPDGRRLPAPPPAQVDALRHGADRPPVTK